MNPAFFIGRWLIFLMLSFMFFFQIGCTIHCTMATCVDGFNIIVQEKVRYFSPGNYQIEISYHRGVYRCNFSITDKKELLKEADCYNNEGSPISENTVDDYFALTVYIYGIFEDVSISLTAKDRAQKIEQSIKLRYHTIYPNGPFCSPTCQRSFYTLTI